MYLNYIYIYNFQLSAKKKLYYKFIIIACIIVALLLNIILKSILYYIKCKYKTNNFNTVEFCCHMFYVI